MKLPILKEQIQPANGRLSRALVLSTLGRRRLGRVNRKRYQSTVISLWISVNILIDGPR
jgi:hypothetical protein